VWNIAETYGVQTLSAQCPASQTREDNRSTLQAEIVRWGAAIVALQECPSRGALGGWRSRIPQREVRRRRVRGSCVCVCVCVCADRVGFARDIFACCLCVSRCVCRRGILWRKIRLVAVRLAPRGLGAAMCGKELRAALRGSEQGTLVVVGDVSVSEQEANDRSDHHWLSAASCDGFSRDPALRKYYASKKGSSSAPKRACAAIACGSAVVCSRVRTWSGRIVVFCDGRDFMLSENFGVLALLRVRSCRAGEASVACARVLHGALGQARDRAAQAEGRLVRERREENSIYPADKAGHSAFERISIKFEGFASAAGPLRSPAAQQIGGPADCCSVEVVEDSSFGARLVCKGFLVGCLVGWLIGWLVGWLADWLAGWLIG
jgi:hypothetical protein